MKLLIIYQEIPERIKLYLIQPESLEHFKQIKICHNNYINASSNNEEIEEALLKLSNYLEDEEPIYISEAYEKNPLTCPNDIDFIIVTGFLM